MDPNKDFSENGHTQHRCPQMRPENAYAMNGDDDDGNILQQCCHHQCSARVDTHAGPYDVGRAPDEDPSCPTVKDVERAQPTAVQNKEPPALPLLSSDATADGVRRQLTAHNMYLFDMEYTPGAPLGRWAEGTMPTVLAHQNDDYLVQTGAVATTTYPKWNLMRGSSVSSPSLAERASSSGKGVDIDAPGHPTDHDVSCVGCSFDEEVLVQRPRFVVPSDHDYDDASYELDFSDSEDDENDLGVTSFDD